MPPSFEQDFYGGQYFKLENMIKQLYINNQHYFAFFAVFALVFVAVITLDTVNKNKMPEIFPVHTSQHALNWTELAKMSQEDRCHNS